MRRDTQPSRQPLLSEVIERNHALRSRAQMLCESARLLREISERTCSESERLQHVSNRLAARIESEFMADAAEF
jgi:hypothetical protein